MEKNLDRILSNDQDVTPSSQFVRHVMAAVRREASMPAPTSFPWWQVMPGLTIWVAALTYLIVVAVIRLCEGSPVSAPGSIILPSVIAIANRVRLGWVLLALVASWAPAKLTLARIRLG